MSRLKDIPSLERNAANLGAVIEAIRETLQTYRGYRGDPLDQALTRRDINSGQFAALLGSAAAIGVGNLGGLGAILGGGTDIEPDLTAPPTPTGLAVSAGISHIYIGTDTPAYTAGHGPRTTVVYGAKWPASDPTAPTFAEAVKLFEYEGTIGAYPSDPATRWAIWAKWKSNDGVESVDPAGGTNGVQATTGQDVRLLIDTLSAAATNPGSPYSKVIFRSDQFVIAPQANYSQESAPGGASVGQLWLQPSTGVMKTWNGSSWQPFTVPLPFIVQTQPTVINGVPIPAGVYMDSAFIYDLTASIARLGNAWIDNAKIADLAVNKLTGGTMQVGAYIQSTNYTSGAGGTGWRINSDGTAELQAAYIRGTITASVFQTALSGQRVTINAPGSPNSLLVYEDIGSGLENTIIIGQSVTTGVGGSLAGTAYANARFGTLSAGNQRRGLTAVSNLESGVVGESVSNSGVRGVSYTGVGVEGASTFSYGLWGSGATGVYGTSTTGVGVQGFSSSGYGGRFSSIKSDGAIEAAGGLTAASVESTGGWVFATASAGNFAALHHSGSTYVLGYYGGSQVQHLVGDSAGGTLINGLAMGGMTVSVGGGFGSDYVTVVINGVARKLAIIP